MLDGSLWSFLGVKKIIASQSEKMLTELLSAYFSKISNVAGIDYLQCENLDEFVASATTSNPEYDYFWNWLDQYGKNTLHETSVLFENTQLDDGKENIAFINYRLFLLQTDLESGDFQGLVYALADTVDSIYEFLKRVGESVCSECVLPPVAVVSFTDCIMDSDLDESPLASAGFRFNYFENRI